METSVICLMDVDSVPEGALAGLAEGLSPVRREKVLRRRGGERRRALGAGLLLAWALEEWGLPGAREAVGPGGRPGVWGHPELAVSLSHSGALAACVLAARPAAVDVQARGRVPEAVVRRCFGPAEQALYAAAGTQEAREAVFFRLWCRLECRVKLRQSWELRRWNLLDPEPGFRYWRLPLARACCVLYGEADWLPPPARLLAFRRGGLEWVETVPFLPDALPEDGGEMGKGACAV